MTTKLTLIDFGWCEHYPWAILRGAIRNHDDVVNSWPGLFAAVGAIDWLDRQQIFYHLEWTPNWTSVFPYDYVQLPSRQCYPLVIYVCFDRLEDAAMFRLFYPEMHLTP